MKVRLEEKLERGEVLEFLRNSPRANFSSTPAWAESLAAAFPGFRSKWLTARDGDRLKGLMSFVEASRGPFHSLWALPFGTYGDPVADDPSVSKALLAEFFRLAGRFGCLEAEASLFMAGSGEGVPAFDTGSEDFLPPGVSVRVEECRLVPLEGGFDEYWMKSIGKRRRQAYKKGERFGVVVRALEGESEVRDFYELYRAESSAWGGVHPYPLKLFLELFGRRGEGLIIWGGFLDGRLLGGHISFFFGSMAQAWQAGLSEQSRAYCVDVMLVIHSIEEACRRGMRIFNLGSSGGNEGLLFFKELLGGREYRYPVVSAGKGWWRWIRRR